MILWIMWSCLLATKGLIPYVIQRKFIPLVVEILAMLLGFRLAAILCRMMVAPSDTGTVASTANALGFAAIPFALLLVGSLATYGVRNIKRSAHV